MLLNGFGGQESGIAEFQLCDLQCGAFDANFLHVAFANRIRYDRVRERHLQSVRGEQLLYSISSLIHRRPGFRQCSIEERKFIADGIAQHRIREPWDVVYFDNIPWFADSVLGDAIRNKFPFFDGTLPEAGATVDQAGDAVKELLTSHGLQVSLAHTVIANPIGEGNVQEIRIEGPALQIAKLEFSDPGLLASKAVQQHLSEILGKPYSRMTIDLFLSEAIRPIYLQQGFLRAKLGPPEVRLTGDPNQKLPSQIPVYVP